MNMFIEVTSFNIWKIIQNKLDIILINLTLLLLKLNLGVIFCIFYLSRITIPFSSYFMR